MHRYFIKKFDECWVPDVADKKAGLSGQLGHPKALKFPINYIGPISRFQKEDLPFTYNVLALISGPEPQRSKLEEILKKELKKYKGSVLLVRGVISDEEEPVVKGNMTLVNYLTSRDLQAAINSSKFIISRSGYTTILDLAVLEKRAFFIPTPGQTEQEYLAKRLDKKGIIPYTSQENFTVKKLAKVTVYKGFNSLVYDGKLRNFFNLFEGKRKLRSNSKFTFNINFLFVRLNNMFNNRQA